MVDTAPNNHSRRHQVLTRASHSEAPARLRLSCSNPLAKPLTRPQLTAGPRTHFRFHSHSAAWPAKCVPTAMGGAPGPGELETGEWRPLAGVASCPCPCSDAILPKNTTAFQLRLVYQWRIRIRQGGEDPKFPIQPDPTRGHSEWRPTETKNHPPAWGPPPPSSLLQFFISPARSPAPSSATSSLAPSIAVPSASSSYPSSSPSGSRTDARRSSGGQSPQCRRRGSPRWTRRPRG